MPPDLLRLDTAPANLTHDLIRFAPELCICTGILLVLLVRLFRTTHAGIVGLLTTLTALGFLLADWPSSGDAFNGMVQLDPLAGFIRGFILIAITLVLILTLLTGFPDAEDSTDFVVLVLGGGLGMMLMASANHLVMVFLAIEMASLPSYVLAGFRRGKSGSSEAALKYVIYGAAASGVMLYGISLLAGRYGSGQLPTVATGIADTIHTHGFDLPLAVSLFFTLIGLLFKLSAVPMHVWLPDVFEGATAEVAAILAIASKGAAVGLTLRLLTIITQTSGMSFAITVGPILAVIAMLTATLGNLTALVQTDLKRMLAYSTIAHAGYLLLGLSILQPFAAAPVLFYLIGYLPMTLGVFVVAAIVRTPDNRATIADCNGLFKRSPVVGITAAVFLFSLLGVPPLAGFAGKFQVFAATYHAAEVHTAAGGWGNIYYIALGVAVVNTVVSAGYYLAVLKAIALEEPAVVDEKGYALPLGESVGMKCFLMALAAAVVAFGIVWDPLIRLTQLATR